MGLSRLNRIVGFLVLIFAVVYGWKSLFEKRRPPCYSVDVKYFGGKLPNSNETVDSSIRPFEIPIDYAQLDDTSNRLKKTRFSQPQILVDHQLVNRSTYGFHRPTAESVREYFLNTFDWEKTVKELNEFQHFKTKIAGLDIHFVRVMKKRKTNEKVEALIFLHGWPGSFYEYVDVARILNTSTYFNYDIIIPSLPGYGYSDAPVRPGMNPIQMARIMHNLMQRLGHSSYVVCGGDWGSSVATFMAKLYPDHVRGLMVTMVIPALTWRHYIQLTLGHFLSSSILLDLDEQEFLNYHFNLFDYLKFLWVEGGYFHLQATKPDTIGYALNDSPMGLAAYILEKWSRWSNNQTVIDQSDKIGLDRFTFEQLWTNVMIYWTTGSITSSMRLYFEYLQTISSNEYTKIVNGPLASSVPVAIVNYREELLYIPRTIARSKYPNIKLWLFHRSGGHFAAIEKPREYALDVEKFFLQLERQ